MIPAPQSAVGFQATDAWRSMPRWPTMDLRIILHGRTGLNQPGDGESIRPQTRGIDAFIRRQIRIEFAKRLTELPARARQIATLTMMEANRKMDERLKK